MENYHRHYLSFTITEWRLWRLWWSVIVRVLSRICKRRGILLVILWLFSLNLFLSNQITHSCIYQPTRSKLTFWNQLGALKSELVSALVCKSKLYEEVKSQNEKSSSPFTNLCIELRGYGGSPPQYGKYHNHGCQET